MTGTSPMVLLESHHVRRYLARAQLLDSVARIALPLLAAGGDMDGYFRMNGLLTILGTGLHVVLVALLIRGLTALAQPPKPIAVEGAPPYR